MHLSVFLGPGTAIGDNFVSFVYVFIEEYFQNSYSGFIFFRKEIVFSVFIMEVQRSCQSSVGDSFDNVWGSPWFILDVPWIINFDLSSSRPLVYVIWVGLTVSY